MLSEIINTYEQFSDALILSVYYENITENGVDNRTFEVTIRCMNKLNDYEWDIIKITFVEVLKFRFIENENTSSTFVNAALLKKEGEGIIVDFFPLIYGQGQLKENPKSDFLVYSKEINYRVLK